METAATPQEIPCPRALRVVAYVLMFQGVCSATDMIASWIMGSGLYINFGVLSIVAVFGLFQGSGGWRIYAIIVFGMLAAGGAAGLGVMVYRFQTDTLSGAWYVFDPGTRAVLTTLACVGFSVLALVCVWCIRVILRRDVKEYCYYAFPRPRVIPRQAKPMLPIVAVLAVLISFTAYGVGRLENPKEHDEHFGGSNLRMRSVAYGCRYGRLAYVVFREKEGSISSLDPDSFRGPDGKKLHLPNRIQLYEVINEKYRESPERVTHGQFEAFLKSEPERYTIDALLDFARKHPAGGN